MIENAEVAFLGDDFEMRWNNSCSNSWKIVMKEKCQSLCGTQMAELRPIHVRHRGWLQPNIRNSYRVEQRGNEALHIDEFQAWWGPRHCQPLPVWPSFRSVGRECSARIRSNAPEGMNCPAERIHTWVFWTSLIKEHYCFLVIQFL